MKLLFILGLTYFSLPTMAQDYAAERSLYLNGIDISSARNQKLKKVDIQIDENGNIFITAPHYDVLEEGAYVPLSKWSNKLNTRQMHKKPSELAREKSPPMTAGDDNKSAENSSEEAEKVSVEKPGTEWPDANTK